MSFAVSIRVSRGRRAVRVLRCRRVALRLHLPPPPTLRAPEIRMCCASVVEVEMSVLQRMFALLLAVAALAYLATSSVVIVDQRVHAEALARRQMEAIKAQSYSPNPTTVPYEKVAASGNYTTTITVSHWLTPTGPFQSVLPEPDGPTTKTLSFLRFRLGLLTRDWCFAISTASNLLVSSCPMMNSSSSFFISNAVFLLKPTLPPLSQLSSRRPFSFFSLTKQLRHALP